MSAKSKLTAILAKIAALQAQAAELEAKAANEIDTDGITVGWTITFPYGRGDTKTEVTGTVLGRKVAEGKGSDVLVVQIGSGIDTAIVRTFPATVTAASAPAAGEPADLA